MILITLTPPLSIARTSMGWMAAVGRRYCYTFVHSNKSQDAIEVLAIIAIVTLLFLAFSLLCCRQFVRCVIAHIESWIVKAQNDR